MHMTAQATQAPTKFRRHPLPANSKTSERRENRLHYRAQVANLCELLASADLTATAYRVALETMARAIRRGTTTEAVPVAWVADRLGVQRNAVSLAYSRLEATGMLRRVAVKHRGAPTRTKLLGFAASLVTEPTPGLTLVESGSSGPSGPDLVIATVAAGDLDCAEPLAACAQTPSQEAEPISPISSVNTASFVFDPDANESMSRKVPKDVRLRAMQCHKPSELPADPAWALSERELAHYLALFPKPEKPITRRSHLFAGNEIVPLQPSPDLASALQEGLPRLELASGSAAKAYALADEIAYQVSMGGLGKGNVLAGVRAGVKLVGQGRWTTPRDWSSNRNAWGGIALRAAMRATASVPGDARNTMH